MGVIKGKTWKFGVNVSTDVIYPSKYLPVDLTDPIRIASHAMAGEDAGFSSKIAKGDIIVAGRNFGCGSSREQATIALKYAGIHRIMLDNFSVDEMKRAVRIINHSVEVEASGNVSLSTVRTIAETGVDIISVGALTHSPKALDISLDITTSPNRSATLP